MRWRVFARLALLASLVLLTVGCAKETTRLAIQAVQLADDDGSNLAPITPAEVRLWVDQANAIYKPVGYEFTFDPASPSDFQVWHNSVVNRVPQNGDAAAALQYDVNANYLASVFYPHKVVVLFRARGGGGWSWGPQTMAYVSMPAYRNTCIAKPLPGAQPFAAGPCAGLFPNSTLLAHELGHYLGLAHTFTGVACAAATLQNTDGDVRGQDPNSSDDDVSDTNPDPGAACAPTQTLDCAVGRVEVNGVQFDPPWTDIMTYHNCLPETISAEQAKVIAQTLNHPLRAALLPAK